MVSLYTDRHSTAGAVERVKFGLEDGIEIHLLCMILGMDISPFAFKTPVGRLRVDE